MSTLVFSQIGDEVFAVVDAWVENSGVKNGVDGVVDGDVINEGVVEGIVFIGKKVTGLTVGSFLFAVFSFLLITVTFLP